ncbi:50S ribosomal protein L25 [bacterium]|nr:50S ribosomal protein L25 [bacterium]
MEDNKLVAQQRDTKGKGPARQMRMKNQVPGIFYYRNDLNIPLSVDANDLKKLMKSKPALINLIINDNEPRECVLREIQRDPIENTILHFDLMGIKRGQKLTVTVPVKLIGIPVGVKTGGGILQLSLGELDIICLPKDIPASLEINVESLEIGSSISVGELDYPELEFMHEKRDTIANVVPPSKIKEAAEAEEEGEELEGEGEEGEEADEEAK